MLHVSNLSTFLPFIELTVNVLIAIFEMLKVPTKLLSQERTKFGSWRERVQHMVFVWKKKLD